MPTAGYFLRLEIEGDRDPIARKVVPFLNRHLAVLPDPDHLSPTNRANLRTEIYDEEGVRVTVTFMPMAPGARGRSNPDTLIVGMGPSIGGCVNTAARIRDRIDAKAGSRYEIDDAPFLVAVALHDLFQTDYEMVTAMYGDEAVEIPSGRSLRRNNGVFGIDNQSPNGRNRRLSAVAFLQQVYALNPDRVGVSVMVNPYAAHDWSPRFRQRVGLEKPAALATKCSSAGRTFRGIAEVTRQRTFIACGHQRSRSALGAMARPVPERRTSA